MTFEERIASMMDWNLDANLYSSLLCMLLVLLLGGIVGYKAHKALKEGSLEKAEHGVLLMGTWLLEGIEGFSAERMGEEYGRKWEPYLFGLTCYLFVAFNWGLLGLPTIVDWIAAPLSLALVMFVLIQYQGIRTNRWGYFHRYVEPIKIWLPINLITCWTPIISTTMRMLGNCLAGTVIIALVQWALGAASGGLLDLVGGLTTSAHLNYQPFWDQNQSYVWTEIFLAPFAMGVLNLYFSLFSGYVQTLVFVNLNALWIGAEVPQPEEEIPVLGIRPVPQVS